MIQSLNIFIVLGYLLMRWYLLRRKDVFDPFYSPFVIVFIMYTVYPLAAVNGITNWFFIDNSLYERNSILVEFFVFILYSSAIVGDLMGIYSKKKYTELRLTEPNLIKSQLIFLFISILCKAYIIDSVGVYDYFLNERGAISNISGVLQIASRLSYVSLVISLIYLFKNWNILQLIIFILSYSLMLTEGNKTAIFLPAFMFLFIFNYHKRYIRLSEFFIAFISFLIIFGFARGYVAHSQDTGISFSLNETFFNYIQRYFGIETAAMVMEKNHFGFLQEYFYFFNNIIPRSIWPDKSESFGILFNDAYSTYISNGYEITASIPPYAVAGFYINSYGILLPIGIYFAFYFKQIFYRCFLLESNKNNVFFVYYVMYLIPITELYFEGYVSDSLAKYIISLIIFNVTIYTVRKLSNIKI